jgi:hypothetical protein
MLSLRKALKEYRDTGALHEKLQPSRFVPGFPLYATKRGDLVGVLSVAGKDPECLADEQLETVTDRFLQTIRFFQSGYRVYQILRKRSKPKLEGITEHVDPVVQESLQLRHQHFAERAQSLSDTTIHYAVVLEAKKLSSVVQAYSIRKVAKQSVEEERNRARQLSGAISLLADSLKGTLTVTPLDRTETKRFLKRLVNYREETAEGPFFDDFALDEGMAQSTPEIFRDHLRVDNYYVQGLTMKDAPRLGGEILENEKPKQVIGTCAGVLTELLSIRGCDLLAVQEFKPLSSLRMRNEIKSRQKGFDQAATSLVKGLLVKEEKSKMEDKSAIKNVDELGDALISVDRGNFFGEYSCHVFVMGESLPVVEKGVNEVFRIFTRRGATLIQEYPGLFDAWLSIVPGNYSFNHRYLYLPVEAYADLSFLWADHRGSVKHPYFNNVEYLTAYETNAGGIHYFNLHVGQVAGAVMYGSQGSGKSVTANDLIDSYQKYWTKIDGEWERPKTLIFDVGGSYRQNTLRHGGTYLVLSLDHPGIKINPFVLPRSKDNIEFIARLIKMLMAGEDDWKPTPEQEQRIYGQIEAMYRLKETRGLSYARFGQMSLGADMQPRFAKWIGEGQYANWFDNSEDTFELSDWLTIEFSGFRKHSHILTPLCFYLWQRWAEVVNDERLLRVPKFFVADEVHVLMLMSEMGEQMLENLNTGRKNNLWNLFVMQWATLLEQHALGSSINAACPMKIFLASPQVSAKKYQQIFEFSETVATQIKRLIPQQQMLVHTAEDTTILNSRFHPKMIQWFSNDVESRAARYEAEVEADYNREFAALPAAQSEKLVEGKQ